ncbi:hypothetical protein EsH8_IV_000530 [Colletotrichum jinshuiense]
MVLESSWAPYFVPYLAPYNPQEQTDTVKMMSKHNPRSHRGYYREDDDLTVTDGSIQRNKDWTTYRKTDTFIAICGAILAATIIGGGIAIGIHFATGGSATGEVTAQGSAANIVPRFPVMQFNAGSVNGTHYGINNSLSGISATGTPTHCADDTDETGAFTWSANKTSAEATTTTRIQMTRTQTIHKSAQGTTVSSAKAVNATMSNFSTAESVSVITEVITTSVTKTAYLTATATSTETNVAPESTASSPSQTTSTSISEAASQAETSSADITSVFLTKTLTATRRKTVSTVEEAVSTTTFTPTTVIRSTVTVTSGLLSSSSHETQCSPDDHTVYITVTETVGPISSVTSSVVSKTSTPSLLAFKSTDTVMVTYTVTIDSLTPPTKAPAVSPSSGVAENTTTATPHTRGTVIVTEVATQTVFVTVVDGTTVAFSTAVSSALGHAGTPVWTSLSSTRPSASTATSVVMVTKTVTDQVTKVVSALATPDNVETSVATVTARPSGTVESSKSILTTVVLTDSDTRTVTVVPKKHTSPAPALNSTRTDTNVVTEVDIRTITVTIGGEVNTSQVTVLKNMTATVTQTEQVAKTAAVTVGESARAYNNTTLQFTATVNTTIYITGTPMMHPEPSTLQPPFPITNGTTFFFKPTGTATGPQSLSTSTSTSVSVSTSTVVVGSNAEKRAEPVIFGFDATGGGKSCTTCLVIFVLGLLILF